MKDKKYLYNHISWGDGFVIVYSICDKQSFNYAIHLLEIVSGFQAHKRTPLILLGNKKDLEHTRQVKTEAGQEVSLFWQCLFYEVSAAENYAEVCLAFQSLIKEARLLQSLKILSSLRRKTSSGKAVSKMFGIVFGKNSSKAEKTNKKRPSLSI